MAEPGRLFVPFARLAITLRNAVAGCIDPTKTAHRRGITPGRRLLVPRACRGIVLRDALAVFIERTDIAYGGGHAEPGCLLEPAARFGIILRYAQAVGVKLTEGVHCCRAAHCTSRPQQFRRPPIGLAWTSFAAG